MGWIFKNKMFEKQKQNEGGEWKQPRKGQGLTSVTEY